MIIEVEDRFCKVAEQFLSLMAKIDEASEGDVPIHVVEERTWQELLELGRKRLSTRT
jgi:hypothetical protein